MGLLIVPASLLALAAGGAVAVALPVRGAIERLVAGFLAAQAVITLTLLLAGAALRDLGAGTILGSLVVLSVVAIGSAIRISRRAGLRARVAEARAEVAASLRAAAADRLVLALAVVAALALAWRFALAIRLPVLDYDGFSYHLVTVDVWLQSGEIGRVPQRIWSDGYPANGELLTLWLMTFGRTDWLAGLSGLLPLPLAALSVTGLARRLGAARQWAAVAGLVFILLPAVIVLANTTYVDNLVAADLAAAWFLGLAAFSVPPGRRRSALLVMTGVAVGLAAGTKTSTLLPLGAFGLALVVAAFAARGDPRTPGQGRLLAAVRTAVLVGIPAAVLGGYWYVKDFLVFGNPVWPFTIGPFNGVGPIGSLIVQTPPQLAGMSPWRQVAASWLGDFRAASYTYDTRIGGYGLAWPVVVALGVVGVALLARSRRFLPIGAIVLPAATTLAVMPMPWWPRLTLFVPVIAMALAALALTRLPRRAGLVLGAVVVLASLVSLGIATRRANATAGPSSASRPSISGLVRLVATGAGDRAELGLWADCRGFEAIPRGATVATDRFNLVHLVVGHDLDRILAPNVEPTADPAVLRAEAAAAGAAYLVLQQDASKAAVLADPTTFEDLGPVCRSVELVRVRSGP